MICIYKITSPSNKVYIGQTRDFEKRMNFYKTATCKSQTLLYNSLKKYGFKNHKIEIIHQCSIDELDNLEIYYIDLYNSFNSPNGLNLKEGGGSNAKLSDFTKNKLRQINLGRKHNDKTKLKMVDSWKKRKLNPISNETRAKLSNAMIGNKRTLGYKTKDETKRKLSIIGIGKIGKNHTNETKNKISKIHKGKIISQETKLKMSKARNRKIIDTSNNVIYKNSVAAAKAAGYSAAAFRRIMRGEINNNTTFKIYTL
jgi:group I intron endonuclease